MKKITMLLGLLMAPSFLLAQFEIIKDINPGPDSCTPIGLNKINDNQVVFGCYDVGNGSQLWVSDGTSEGTDAFYETAPDANSNYLLSTHRQTNDSLLLRQWTYKESKEYEQFWLTDGTSTGTKMVAELLGFVDDYFVAPNNAFIILSDLYNLGIDEGLYIISDEGAEHILPEVQQIFGISGSKVVLSKAHAIATVYDLNTKSTQEITLPGSGSFSNHAVINGYLIYMSQAEGLNAVNLETLSHSLLLSYNDIAPGIDNNGYNYSFSTSPYYVIDNAGYFYIYHANLVTDSETIPSAMSLITTNGASASIAVKTGAPKNDKYGRDAGLIAQHNNEIFFSLPNTDSQEELWRLNPTNNEASFVTRVTASDTWGMTYLTSVNDLLYFQYQQMASAEYPSYIYSLNTDSMEMVTLSQGFDSIGHMRDITSGIIMSATTPEFGSELYFHKFSTSDGGGTDGGGTDGGGTDDGGTDDGGTDDGGTGDGGTGDGGTGGGTGNEETSSSGGGSTSYFLLIVLLLLLSHRIQPSKK